MTDILWLRWQTAHIERRHGVSAREFEEAWDDPNREGLSEDDDPERGPYFRSIGATSEGRVIEMVWRWQRGADGDAVWPITAYFRRKATKARRRRARGRRRRT
jgi:hypothetical protein